MGLICDNMSDRKRSKQSFTKTTFDPAKSQQLMLKRMKSLLSEPSKWINLILSPITEGCSSNLNLLRLCTCLEGNNKRREKNDFGRSCNTNKDYSTIYNCVEQCRYSLTCQL